MKLWNNGAMLAVIGLAMIACGDDGKQAVDDTAVADTAVGEDAGVDSADGPDVVVADIATGDAVAQDVQVAEDVDVPPDTASGDTVAPADLSIDDSSINDTSSEDSSIDDSSSSDVGDDVATADLSGDDAAGEDVVTINGPPVITSAALTDRPVGLPGDSFGLVVAASDPDGDTLTYTWSQVSPATAVGAFGATNTAGVSWVAGEVAEMTVVSFQVVISDGINADIIDTVDLTVNVPRFATDIQPIFSGNCGGCHLTNSSGGLSLLAASSWTNLVNVSGNNTTCSTLKRVLPGQPDSSLLVKKISGSDCGTRMPSNNRNHFVNNPAQLTRIRAWVLAGAQND